MGGRRLLAADWQAPILTEGFRAVRGARFAVLPPEQTVSLLDLQFRAWRQHWQATARVWQLLVSDERETTAVGYALTQAEADGLRLVDLAILPQHQRQGHGHWLLNQLLAQLAPGQTLELKVDIGNTPAEMLYRRLGFETLAEDGLQRTMRYHR